MQSHRRGWDLEFDTPDDRRQFVEVKGSARSGRFVLTKNELRAARSNSNWALLFVTNLLRGANPVIIRFSALGEEITDKHLDGIAWNVRWEGLTHDVIEVIPDSDKAEGPPG